MSLLQNSNAIETGGYPISNSLRFQSASSQYLSRTPASAGSLTTWTWSGWVKRGALSSFQRIFSTTANASQFYLRFNNTDTLLCETASSAVVFNTTQVFRDPSSWYHIVFTWDTTNATASDRVRLYVNGTRVTAFATINNPTLNATSSFNTAAAHYIGSALTTEPVDGYMAEVNFIDGQALTPSSFGETNTLTGQWVAKKYTGTYGTNGFYLPFSNGTSTTTLGADSSGNANNWTLTNFTRSAGVSDCWMYDVPSGNGSSVGGTQPNSNYAVLNPLARTVSPQATLAAANLSITSPGTTDVTYGSIGVSSGKWYWELTLSSAGTNAMIGFSKDGGLYDFRTANGYAYYGFNGQKYNNNAGAAYGSSYTTNDVIGVALDMDAGTVVFYKNNVSQGTAFTGLSGIIFPSIQHAGGVGSWSCNANFGQRSFSFTPPSGFKALCTANLPTSTIVKGNKYMDATLVTGTGGVQTVTNAGGFKPDWVWNKGRSAVSNNVLVDSVRGIDNYLWSNSTNAEASGSGYTSLNSNGFSVNGTFGNGVTYVAWQWQAGQGTTSSNTNGSITSTVSVSTTAGFSIVTYTGNGTAGATIGHGLGVAPKMVIVKRRDNSVDDWCVYHTSIGNTGRVRLNTTAATQTNILFWNNTSPTGSVFTVGADSGVNVNASTYVAYCFAEIAGFSKFGSYTGNGSTSGVFVYTGFRPRWILLKDSSNAYNWYIIDTARSPYNVTNETLAPNTTGFEDSAWGSYAVADVLSNGFRITYTGAPLNTSGATFIYAAFAENPFAQANAR